MADGDTRPRDRHLRKPIGYRPPADVWPLLDARTAQTGHKASAIITEALREYLAKPAAVREAGENAVA